MALTRIEYGSLASSSVMNNNFGYLDDSISGVASNLSSTAAGLNSNISSINSSIALLSDEIQEDLTSLGNSVDNKFSQNGLYITTYTNGTSWYREWFSDAEKTTRVWIEQGGYSWNPTFLKSFANTNYCSVVTGVVYQFAVRITGKTKTGMTFEQWHTASGALQNDPVWWYACGK